MKPLKLKIKPKYAIYSTIENDPIFSLKSHDNVIYSGGEIVSVGSKIYNFNPGDLVCFIYSNHETDFRLSSNLVIKLIEEDPILITLIPYLSYAMKIIRHEKIRLGDRILILGFNFFSILLAKVLNLTNSDVQIINLRGYNNSFSSHSAEILDLKETEKIKNLKKVNFRKVFIADGIENFDKIKEILRSNYDIINLIPNLEIPSSFLKLSDIKTYSLYDKGLRDKMYREGIKYPYSYVRWDFKRNLKFVLENYFGTRLSFNNIEKMISTKIIKNKNKVERIIKDKELEKGYIHLFQLT